MAAHVVTETQDGQDKDIGGLQADSLLTWIGTILGPTSYATGGNTVVSLIPDLDGTIVHVQSGVRKDWTWGLSGQSLLAYVASTGVQVANAVDMSTGAAIPVVIYYRKA